MKFRKSLRVDGEVIDFRYNEKVQESIRWLMVNFKDKFDNESHMIRCAILLLEKKLKEELRKNAL